jgi:two-component system chemotaxis response regulator CheB
VRPVPTRVLVVDDSVVVRRLVALAVEAEPDLEVAGVAADGRAALEKVARLAPDVVVLDLEMPEMDGLRTLGELRRLHPDLPVIVFSHLTAAGAAATFDALAAGATDFALKPSASGSGMAVDHVRTELLPLVRALGPRPAPNRPVRASGRSAPARVEAVVVAVSTGGPNALAGLCRDLPADLPVPVLVVQHMPPVFTGILAERLTRASAVPAVEAQAGERVVPGRVYVAPGGRHLAVEAHDGDVVVVLGDGPPENSCRPAGDVLFRAAAEVWGPGVLAVVMTGMGADGLRGAEAVHRAGGSVIVQSPATAVVASMPSAVIDAGIADAVVHLDDLAAVLVRHARAGR